MIENATSPIGDLLPLNLNVLLPKYLARLPAWLGTHVITAGRTQTDEDKIAIVINLATRVQKFFDEMCKTIFNLIRRITCELG
jgi:hypothetical protein